MGNSLLDNLIFKFKRLQDSNQTAEGATVTELLSNTWGDRVNLYENIGLAELANPGSVGAMFSVVGRLGKRTANLNKAEEQLSEALEKTNNVDSINKYLTGVNLANLPDERSSLPEEERSGSPTGRRSLERSSRGRSTEPRKEGGGGGTGTEDDPEEYVGVKDVTMNDRFIFVAVTYVIRMISLFFIDWAVSTNMISNFKDAFMYYTGLYCLMFVFLTLVVSNSDIGVQMLLYYMNTDANGYSRMILHLFLIFLLLPILYVIQDPSTNTNVNTTDYEYKERISKSMTIFTLISWMLTSAIALRF